MLRRITAPALALSVALILAGQAIAGEAPSPAPRFMIEKPGGGYIGSANIATKAVIVTFWATWCAPCVQEIPHLNEAYNKYKGEGFLVVGINYQQDEERVARFLQKTQVDYPVGLDKDGAVGKKFGVKALPASALIGKDGRLIRWSVGAMTPAVIEEWVKEALGK